MSLLRTSRTANVYIKHYSRRLNWARFRNLGGTVETNMHTVTGQLFQNNIQKTSLHTTACQLKSHYEHWAYLSHEDLEALIDSGDIQLIDIREEKEIGEQGVFPGAINIPLQDLKKALQMTDEAFTEKYKAPKPQHKDTNIVFAGFKSVKSSAALEIAHKLGFKKARQYKNGFEEWGEIHSNHKRAGAA